MTPTADPQTLVTQARQLYEAGDLPAAAQAFLDAAQAYRAAGDELMAAEMMNNLCVARLRAGEPQAALEAVEGTGEIFSARGDQRRLGIACANRATVLQALRRIPEAISDFEKAGQALEQAGEDQMRLHVMQLLSALHLRRFKFINAVIALQAGLAGVKDPTPKQRFMKKLLFFRL